MSKMSFFRGTGFNDFPDGSYVLAVANRARSYPIHFVHYRGRAHVRIGCRRFTEEQFMHIYNTVRDLRANNDKESDICLNVTQRETGCYGKRYVDRYEYYIRFQGLSRFERSFAIAEVTWGQIKLAVSKIEKFKEAVNEEKRKAKADPK